MNDKKKHLLFVVNVSDFFLSHRLPIATEAMQKGYRVSLASGDKKNTEKLTSLGIEHHDIPLTRSGKNIFSEIFLLLSLYRLIRKLKPDLIHTVSIKPVLYVGLINYIFFKKPIVSAVSGLGYVFIGKTWKHKLAQSILKLFYKVALKGDKARVIFQNTDDKQFFITNKLVKESQVNLIKGAGISLLEYRFESLPNSNIVNILLPARLLWDKGVREYIEAAKILGPKYPVKFMLVGELDRYNPSVVDKTALKDWLELPYITWLGYRNDMVSIYSLCDIVCLPSYREGMPRALLEAQACGRPIVTTNVAGCREAILPNKTGFLAEPKDADDLASKLERLIIDRALRETMGKSARAWAEDSFSIGVVIEETFSIYEAVIAPC